MRYLHRGYAGHRRRYLSNLQTLQAGTTQRALKYIVAVRRALFDPVGATCGEGKHRKEQRARHVLAPLYAFHFAQDVSDTSINLEASFITPSGQMYPNLTCL